MHPTRSAVRTVLQPIAIAVGLAMVARAAVHIYAIPSASMSPALAVGDQVVVTRYFGRMPERGHVIVFQSPLVVDELMVKRVIGMPGDLIDSRLGRVRVGEHTLAEPYVLRQAASGSIQAQIVPPGCYFVMGDNRDDSYDSRNWGVVPADRVIGRARLVLWTSPVDPSDREILAAPVSHTGVASARRARHVFKWVE
jgi:signal peptidase I